ncbi:MAG TPA: RIP metalloprotease RseP [Opitutaceae bacterium]|nr:RIP metalloprotease RseP [Opitutaceae bacterium]
MSTDLIHSVLSNSWAIFLIILFFGGSIFVHELGHFLAARSRGVHVEVFSIGMGPPMFSWTAKSGTRYQIAWFPLGGFVLLPQIADLGPVEGQSQVDVEKLPPVTYGTKLLVFVAGAAFNVLFAFVLACVVWVAGQPENIESVSTTIGYIAKTIEMPDGTKVPSPALVGGLQVGDVVKSIDGHPISNWDDLHDTLIMGSGRDTAGGRSTTFAISRAGKPMEITLHPILTGEEHLRQVGVLPGYTISLQAVEPNSVAEKAGLKANDAIETVNGVPVMNFAGFSDELSAQPNKESTLGILRAGAHTTVVLPAHVDFAQLANNEFSSGSKIVHPSPFAQIEVPFIMTIRTVWDLINPHSDIGLNKVSGPLGIVHNFHMAAEAGIRTVLRLTILINVNLAILNLLPIPVLDGGQIVFATIGRLRGRQLPVNFVVTMQSVFVVLIVSFVVYVSVFDVRRWSRDNRDSRAQVPVAAAPAAAKP